MKKTRIYENITDVSDCQKIQHKNNKSPEDKNWNKETEWKLNTVT